MQSASRRAAARSESFRAQAEAQGQAQGQGQAGEAELTEGKLRELPPPLGLIPTGDNEELPHEVSCRAPDRCGCLLTDSSTG
jgi:hypothetical protein